MLGRREILQMTAAAAGIGLVRRNATAAAGVRLICGFGAGAVIPLQIDGPSAVLETIARDRRVAESLIA